MNLESRFGGSADVIPGFPHVGTTLPGNLFSLQRNNPIIEPGLFDHYLNFGSHRVSVSILFNRNGQSACFSVSGFPVSGQFNTRISQVAPIPTTPRFQFIKSGSSFPTSSPANPGKGLILEINFHTIHSIIIQANETLDIFNVFLNFLKITNGSIPGRINHKFNLCSVSDGNHKFKVSTGNGNTVVRGHVSGNRCPCNSIQDFPFIRVFSINTNGIDNISGCKGSVVNSTPNLDRICANG